MRALIKYCLLLCTFCNLTGKPRDTSQCTNVLLKSQKILRGKNSLNAALVQQVNSTKSIQSKKTRTVCSPCNKKPACAMLIKNPVKILGNTSIVGDLCVSGNIIPKNFLLASDTTLQNANTANTFQSVYFNTIDQQNGWIRTPGRLDSFTAPTTGLYLMTYNAIVSRLGGADNTLSFIAKRNNVDIPGSESFITVTSTGSLFTISRTFLANINAGDRLSIEFTGTITPQARIDNQLQTGQPKISITLTVNEG